MNLYVIGSVTGKPDLNRAAFAEARAKAARIIGWIDGFAKSIWIPNDGEAELREKVGRLWSLVIGECREDE